MVNGFINCLQVVTAVSYTVVLIFTSTNHSSVYSTRLQYPFPDNRFLTQELHKVWLDYTLLDLLNNKSLLITINIALPLFLHLLVSLIHKHASPLLVIQLNTGTSTSKHSKYCTQRKSSDHTLSLLAAANVPLHFTSFHLSLPTNS
jgi:hypothetical protein